MTFSQGRSDQTGQGHLHDLKGATVFGMARYEVRWGDRRFANRPIGEEIDLRSAFELTESDLVELLDALHEETEGDASLDARVSSTGKGAAGPAIALALEVGHVAGGVAGLYKLGRFLTKAIIRIRERLNHDPVIEDPDTLGALAAVVILDSDGSTADALQEYQYIGTVPVTASPGMGTDARDIWASCFVCPPDIGGAAVVFMSPSGLSLGSVRVPFEMYLKPKEGWQQRSVRDIALWWGRDV
jgi:hypothetical protein